MSTVILPERERASRLRRRRVPPYLALHPEAQRRRWQELPWAFWALLTLLVGGIVVRVETFLDNPSMWLDEVGLAISFLQIDYSDVLAPLPEVAQQAPPLFNLAALFVIRTLGTSEFAFRLLPLIASVASLLLFAVLARRLLSPRGSLVAIAMFAGTPLAIRYAGEFKPYATDVLATIVILLLALGVLRSGFSRRRCGVLGLAGIALVWGSYTAIFTLAGVGTALLYEAVTSASTVRRARVVNTVVLGATWVLGFGLFWFFVGRQSAAGNFYEHWAEAFAPMPFSLGGMEWYWDAVTDVMRNPVGWAFGKKFGALVIVTGAGVLLARKRFAGLMVVAPFGFLWLASALGQYPFSGRLIFFTLPLLLLAMGQGVDRIVGALAWARQKIARTGRLSAAFGRVRVPRVLSRPVGVLAAGFLVAVLVQPGLTIREALATTVQREESRPLVEYYLEHRRAGDATYCYRWALNAFRYYTHDRNATCTAGVHAAAEPWRYDEDLERLKGAGRVWVLFAHVNDAEEEKYFIPFLEAHGRRLEEHRTEGASLYLYEM